MEGSRTLSKPAPWHKAVDRSRSGHNFVPFCCRTFAVVLGAADAWASRFRMYPDGISYLDLGDAIWRGDWHNVINGYWSPVYPAILGLFLRLFKPSIYAEYPLVHLVNFLIYVLALICFEIFLRTFVEQQKRRDAERDAQSEIGLPAWGWYVAGYAIFTASSLFLITTTFVSGDMIISAVVYFAFTVFLKIRAGEASWRTFALLGFVLGIGYLTKTAMFLIAVPFIVVAAIAQTDRSRSLRYAAVAFLFFALVAGPYVAMLSLQKGRPTFGESGAINYIVNVNGGQFYISKNAGAKHPIRELGIAPDAYEYVSPIAGTYPLWYDPSYWHEGILPHFDLKQQLRVSALCIAICGWILFNPFLGLEITVAILLLYLIAPRPSVSLKRAKEHWLVWIPALCGIGLYCLVVVEYRYVGGLCCVLWIVGLAGVQLPANASSRRMISTVVCLLALSTLAISVRQIWREARGTDFPERQFATAETPRIAAALQSAGVHPGDGLAVISDWLFPSRQGAYLARLTRAHIIGEVRPEQFWSADAESRAKL